MRNPYVKPAHETRKRNRQAERQQPANSRDGHRKPAKGISLQALPVKLLPTIMGTHHCEYSLTSGVLPVTVGTPLYRGYFSLSWVLLIVVGTLHYREYSPILRVLTPHCGYSLPSWVLPVIRGTPTWGYSSISRVLINTVGAPSASFLQPLALD